MDTAILHNISDYLRQTYRLTRTETQICEYLLRGNTRPDLRRLLDANENCLKWHLKQVYAKTLGDSPLERDKLQRLTALLMRIQNRPNENYT